MVVVVVVDGEDGEHSVGYIVVVGTAKQGKTEFSQERRDRGTAEIPTFAVHYRERVYQANADANWRTKQESKCDRKK